MVYIPKPRPVQRIIGEILGFGFFVFISRAVVATTGGSTAFATNILWNALGNGIGFGIPLFLYPFAVMDFTLLICMVMHEVLLWAIGKRGFSVVDVLLYSIFVPIQLVVGCIDYLLIWIYVPSSASNLGIPIVPAAVEPGRAVGSEIVQAAAFVFGFFLISEYTGFLFRQAKTSRPRDPNSDKPRPYNYLDHVVASAVRALLIGMLRTGISLGGIPITGGFYNTIGYVSGAIVSWEWKSTWYVNSICPLGGIIGFFLYIVAVILPTIPWFKMAFGASDSDVEELNRRTGALTRLPSPAGKEPPSSMYASGNMRMRYTPPPGQAYRDGRPIEYM